jgi:Ca2+-binding RTX toxin-like protein
MANVIYGTASGEILVGSNEADIIYGNGGNDVIRGLGGNDTLVGGTGTTFLFGGLGNDIYVITDAASYASEYLGGGIDTLYTSVSMTDPLANGIENLFNAFQGGALTLRGNELDNLIVGSQASDTMYGNGGNDTIIGSAINPSGYHGGEGNDHLIGGAASDGMAGENGNDVLEGRGAPGGGLYDFLDGGAGNDTYVLTNQTGATFVITDASGIDTITSTISRNLGTYAGIERLTLLGTASIAGIGNASNNLLVGNTGVNLLSGLGGTDLLRGGSGRDILAGGAQNDTFDFNAVLDSGKTAATRDRIVDFSHGHDKIDLSTIDAKSGIAGNQAFVFFAVQGTAFTGVKGQLRWHQENLSGATHDRTIIAGDVNGDKVADFQIELSGLKVLNVGDFVL